MEQMIQRCAGLDVHKAVVVATVRVPDGDGSRAMHTETFSTTTTSLLALHDWLHASGVTHIAMESTGVYWKPVYYALEDGFTLLLVNARHVKNVPGRKTDVKDSEWLAQLLECGLLRAIFVPPPPIRDLRDLTRYRRKQIDERGREVQRLHQVLEDAGIKLATVATDVMGVSGRAMDRSPYRGDDRSRDAGRSGARTLAAQTAGLAGGAAGAVPPASCVSGRPNPRQDRLRGRRDDRPDA